MNSTAFRRVWFAQPRMGEKMAESRKQRAARIAALAELVFETKDLADEFLNSPQPQLNGECPIDLVRSDRGMKVVEELLFRIEYSLPV